MNKIKLGDKVKDPITGITGIAVGITEWLHGCNRIVIQPKGHDKDMKAYESFNVDEPQLIVIKPKKVKRGSKKTGGPMPTQRQKMGIKKFN